MDAVYFHIPFCRKKCFYCSFIVAIAQQRHMRSYADALCTQMRSCDSRTISSIYFGGGTPSQLPVEDFQKINDRLRKSFVVDDQGEYGIEINPEDVTPEKLQCYRDAGVNRISIGVQTFQDHYLRLLGRVHSAMQAQEAYETARRAGFSNISLDLMYGFPGQTISEIEQDLKVLCGLDCEHVSLYSLTIEPGSKFYRELAGSPAVTAADKQYLFVRDYLCRNGFEHYEVSNFSKYGYESRHNLNYWRGGNYLGFGVAAHSHENGRRWWNMIGVRDYVKRVEQGESVVEGEEFLSSSKRLSEALVFGLRMITGVSLSELTARYGCDFSEEQKKMIVKFCMDEFLRLEDGVLRATNKGLLVLDDISVGLL
ncbi:MAG TPA: radical SAM family heme chaperone HemW [Candidatus Bathyarchaeia archaeon]|nr:radical SAM family heme chaperone HemW [Candidatus Bathyarchaeia archaeon]